MNSTNKANGILEWTLLAFAFTAPITIALAEPLAYLILPLFLWSARSRSRSSNPLFWPITIFVAAVALSSVLGLRPALSFRKMDRLLLLGVVFALPFVAAGESADRWKLLRNMAALFVAGACIKALFDIVRIPYALITAQPPPGGVEPEMPLLYTLGNMREPQMFMVALCFLVGAL